MSMQLSPNRSDQKYKKQNRGKRWTSAEAWKQLEAWQRSGMSMAAFCRERGIHVRRLYHWRSRLDKWEGNDRNRVYDRGYKERSDCKSLRWVEAEITCADRERVSNPALTIRLGDGQQIDISDPQRVEVSWLLQLTHGLCNQLTR